MFVIPCHVVSRLVLSCHLLSSLFLFCLDLKFSYLSQAVFPHRPHLLRVSAKRNNTKNHRSLSSLVLSLPCFVFPCLVVSCLGFMFVLFICHLFSCLVLSNLVLPCLVFCHRVLSCLGISYLVICSLVFSCLLWCWLLFPHIFVLYLRRRGEHNHYSKFSQRPSSVAATGRIILSWPHTKGFFATPYPLVMTPVRNETRARPYALGLFPLCTLWCLRKLLAKRPHCANGEIA